MKILKAFKDVALFPVRALKQVKDDLTSDDETDAAKRIAVMEAVLQTLQEKSEPTLF